MYHNLYYPRYNFENKLDNLDDKEKEDLSLNLRYNILVDVQQYIQMYFLLYIFQIYYNIDNRHLDIKEHPRHPIHSVPVRQCTTRLIVQVLSLKLL